MAFTRLAAPFTALLIQELSRLQFVHYFEDANLFPQNRFPLRQPEFTLNLGDELSNRWMLRCLMKRGFVASITTDGLLVTIHGDVEDGVVLERVSALKGVELL